MRLILVVCTLGLSACSLLERRMVSEEQNSSSYRPMNERHLVEAKEELGLTGRYMTADDYRRLEDRVHLKDLESRLYSRNDKAQYYQIKPALKNDQERIQFLSLNTPDSKAAWVKGRGLGNNDKHSAEVVDAIEKKDIALGMNQSAVRESWGDPDAVETAGDSVYGYERWRYQRFVSGNDGYQKELRLVYFEGGRVVGWESH